MARSLLHCLLVLSFQNQLVQSPSYLTSRRNLDLPIQLHLLKVLFALSKPSRNKNNRSKKTQPTQLSINYNILCLPFIFITHDYYLYFVIKSICSHFGIKLGSKNEVTNRTRLFGFYQNFQKK